MNEDIRLGFQKIYIHFENFSNLVYMMHFVCQAAELLSNRIRHFFIKHANCYCSGKKVCGGICTELD